jgi:D-serine deaminase-like pyridoxal phosphate-dependent protein
MEPVARLDEATEHLDPPFAVVDLDAFDRNAATLERRAGGKPLRLATKSVRSRPLIDRVLARPGFTSVLAFTLPEALWLAGDDGPTARDGVADVLVGYPTADRAALARLVGDETAVRRVTLTVDSTEHLDHIEQVLPPGPPVRLCLDLDASLRLLGGALHLGMRRSPVHRPAQLRALAEEVARRPRLTLVGTEGAGEVQTPLTGPGAAGLRIGERVWFRHAKAGELCEHVDLLHLVAGADHTGAAATYRGARYAFL